LIINSKNNLINELVTEHELEVNVQPRGHLSVKVIHYLCQTNLGQSLPSFSKPHAKKKIGNIYFKIKLHTLIIISHIEIHVGYEYKFLIKII
jgi:hypothetical protein